MKRIVLLCAAFALSGCAVFSGSTPEAKVADAERQFTNVFDKIADAREPCVPTAAMPQYGADHPQCMIDDATFNDIILPIARTANICLDDARAAVDIGDLQSVPIALQCSRGALQTLSLKLLE